jgi:hypothetical protein
MWFLRTWEIVVAIEGGLAIEMMMAGMTVGDSGRSLFGQVMRPPRANQRAKNAILGGLTSYLHLERSPRQPSRLTTG